MRGSLRERGVDGAWLSRMGRDKTRRQRQHSRGPRQHEPRATRPRRQRPCGCGWQRGGSWRPHPLQRDRRRVRRAVEEQSTRRHAPGGSAGGCRPRAHACPLPPRPKPSASRRLRGPRVSRARRRPTERHEPLRGRAARDPPPSSFSVSFSPPPPAARPLREEEQRTTTRTPGACAFLTLARHPPAARPKPDNLAVALAPFPLCNLPTSASSNPGTYRLPAD